MLSIIVAISNNNAIGKDNKMLWHLPEDMKRFKELTTGHVIIMGRKTFESLGKVLPNRKHIILTRDENYKVDNENVEIVNDISQIDKYVNDENENFVIGGAIIYNQLMKKANKLYVTKVKENFDGDAYFPKINEDEWKVVGKEQRGKDEKNPYDYEFITYVRK